jgi:hypothetical protein
VTRRGGPAGVHRHLHVTVGAVLEPHWHRQAGRHLPVHLALGGAGADRTPGRRVGEVLGRDGVQPLAASGQAESQHVEQQTAGHPQAAVHIMATVHARATGQAFPCESDARLLQVHPHDNQQVGGVLVAQPRQPARVADSGDGVMH